MFDPIKRPRPADNRPLSFNGGSLAQPKSTQFAETARSLGHTVREVSMPKVVSPRITNMLDRVTDLIADTNSQLAQMPQFAPERPAMMTARTALLQAQRELTTV